MRCEDIEKYLNKDTGDLDEISRHLETCPACNQRYAGDLELETALRQLSLASENVDITENLKVSLYHRYKQQYRLRLIQKCIWITASLATVVLLIINLPIIAGWLNYGYNIFLGKLSALKFADSINIGQLADKVESSRYFLYFTIFVMAFFVVIMARLWREFKEIFN